jgi:hypothetical protein
MMKRTWWIGFSLLLLLLGRQESAQARPAQQAIDWRFGVIESYTAPRAANNLGVSWTRVRFQWAETQPDGPDSWKPRISDEQIDGEVAAGREVVGLLIGIPDWARGDDKLPTGLYLPHDDPDNTWAVFVREMVERYDGRINHWIIWNEPDIDDPAAPGHTWDGSIEDFIQLLRVAYLVAKESNPDAVIHLPAFTYFWNPDYIGDFFDALIAEPDAAANGYFFDVATAHLYFQPTTIYDVIRILYDEMAARGLPWRPVWLVETNAPPIDDEAWPVENWTLSVTMTEQAAFIPQAMAAALAAGAERMAVYKLLDLRSDRAANPEPFGLLRMQGTRRPAFETYIHTIRYMAGAIRAERERWDEVGQIRIDQAGRTTTVLFARLPGEMFTAVIPATAPSALWVDMWGRSRVIEAEDGEFRVELPGALCTQSIGDYCMIGGTTYYLVQATQGDNLPPTPLPPGFPTPTPDPEMTPSPTGTATATPTTPPTATTTPTVTLTPSATPSASPTPTATNTPSPSPLPTVTSTETVTAVPPTAVPPTPTPIPPPPPESPPLGYWFLGTAVLVGFFIAGLWLMGRKN